MVIGGNQDPGDERGLFNTPVNVLYQCFSGDFGYRLSRETGGIESCGDDRNGGINLHQKHRTSWYHGDPGHCRSIFTRHGAHAYQAWRSASPLGLCTTMTWRVSAPTAASRVPLFQRGTVTTLP